MSYEQFAVQFADALTQGDFDGAHRMLATDLRQELTADSLRAEFDSMTGYFDSAAQVDGHTETMRDWPGKGADDLGWVYVSISGAPCSEAVTVIVSDEDDGLVISNIEWGRP